MLVKKLRELAEKATPGPWKNNDWGVRARLMVEKPDDIKFIIAANPQVMLKMLDVVDETRQFLELFSKHGEMASVANLKKSLEALDE